MSPKVQDRAIVAVCTFAVVAVVVRLAWLSDDVYITMRMVENWLAGRGLVWNVDERVQTCTTPLWMFVIAACRAATGEAFYTVIAAGTLCCAAAVALLLAACGSRGAVVASTVVLLAAHSFPEYSTGGLDSPLACLLLVLLVQRTLRPPPWPVLPIAVLTGLLAFTRHDFVLLAGPVLVTAVWRQERRVTAVGVALLGMAPLVAWLAFAAFYYGSPLPITAYSKALGHGVPLGELLPQGLRHLAWVSAREPATILAIAGGCALGLRGAVPGARPIAIGMLLYVAYVVRIGGDFMAGRLLVTPLVAAVAIVGRWLAGRRPALAVGVAAGAAVLGTTGGTPAWLRSPAAEAAAPESRASDPKLGIFDERANYWLRQGLFSPQRDVPEAGVFSAAMRKLGRDTRVVMVWGQVGRFGFEAGDLVHIVDRWLCDPLLMRLPAESWRSGHFLRSLPDGYLETVATGENRLRHAGLASFYATVHAATAAPLWSAEHFEASWRLWTGADEDGRRDYVAASRDAQRLVLTAAELSPMSPVGRCWFAAPQARVLGRGGIEVRMPAPARARALRVSLQPPANYRIELRLGADLVSTMTVDSNRMDLWRDAAAVFAQYEPIRAAAPHFFASPNGNILMLASSLGMQQFDVELPAAAGAFDAVRIDAVQPPMFAISACGGIELVD